MVRTGPWRGGRRDHGWGGGTLTGRSWGIGWSRPAGRLRGRHAGESRLGGCLVRFLLRRVPLALSKPGGLDLFDVGGGTGWRRPGLAGRVGRVADRHRVPVAVAIVPFVLDVAAGSD